MSFEETLARALQDEADHIDVDVYALHAGTRERLAGRRPVRQPKAWPHVVLVAACVALLLVAGLTGTRMLLQGRGGGLLTGAASQRGQVAATFSCPSQVSADAADRRRDDALVLDLGGGPAAAASSVGAPMYAYSQSGDTATLRLGNKDGSLASTATFHRAGGRWVLDTTARCSGVGGQLLVPGDDPFRLGRRDRPPYDASDMFDQSSQPVLVDDRDYYDTAGLVRHRSIWVAPCSKQLCVAAGRGTSYVTDEVPSGGTHPRVQEETSLFLPPDDTVGRPQPLGLWVVYDPGGDYTAVYARTRTGRHLAQGVRLTGPAWVGQAYAVLAPRKQVSDIAVATPHGLTSADVTAR
jgi:hypothetical protein